MVLAEVRRILAAKDEDTRKAVGARMKSGRHSRGLTIEQVAVSLGVSSQSVSNWESGAFFPGIENLVQLMDLYAISLDWVIGREEATAEEANLLVAFRDLPLEGKAVIRGALRGMLEHEAQRE